jgi:hypothetical protein
MHGGRKLVFLRPEIDEWMKGKKLETLDESCTQMENDLFKKYQK